MVVVKIKKIISIDKFYRKNAEKWFPLFNASGKQKR